METDQKIDEIASLIWLSKVKGSGPVRFREIYEKFGSFSRFVNLISRSTESLTKKKNGREWLGIALEKQKK